MEQCLVFVFRRAPSPTHLSSTTLIHFSPARHLLQHYLRYCILALYLLNMPGRPSPAEPQFPWRSDLLAGQVAIVTGGSAGIGAAITDSLVSACDVFASNCTALYCLPSYVYPALDLQEHAESIQWRIL